MIETRDLRKSFGSQKVLDGISFKIEEGESVVIIGGSGCGKSVTARAILNMVKHPGRITGGEVINQGGPRPIDLTKLDPKGEEIRHNRWGEISMILQEPMTSLSPVHTIVNQMIEAITLHTTADK
jgi:ABC-type glutathione transport system ATPase component